MADPTPDYIALLQGHGALLSDIRSTCRDQSRAMLDILEVVRHMSVRSARELAEHEAAGKARHEEIRPVLDAYRREIEAREKAHAEALAEAQAEITRLQTLAQGRGKVDQAEADASAAKIRRYALRAVEWLFLLLVGGGGVAGYLGLDKAAATTPPAEEGQP